MRRFSTLSLGLPALLLIFAGQLLPSTALAEHKNPLAGQPAVRHKLELRKNRFEVAPQFVVAMNPSFRVFMGAGAVLNYHLTDWLGLAIQVAGGGNVNSSLANAVNEQLLPAGMSGRPAYQPTREQFKAHLQSLDFMGSLYAQVTPFAGKMQLFSALYTHYDFYGMVGVGMMHFNNGWGSYTGTKLPAGLCTTGAGPNIQSNPDGLNGCDPMNAGVQVAGMFGLGFHVFFNDWVAFNAELRDYLANTNPGGLDTNGDNLLTKKDRNLSNNLFVGVGASFFFPLKAKISK